MVALLLIVVAGVLFFGLRPKGYDYSNRVSLIEESGGLQFEKYSIAYTQPFSAPVVQQLESLGEFTIFLNFWPQPDFNDGFGLILIVHSGDDADQLVIGQWKSHIIAMNGDDYAHKRRLPRISFDISKKSKIDKSSSGIQVALTSNQAGTRLYVNGRLVKEKPKMVLKVPAGDGARLILGNSPYGRAAWNGNIYSLALFQGTFQETEMAYDSDEGVSMLHADEKSKASPVLLYDFKSMEQGRVKDCSRNGVHLDLPESIVPLKKKMLTFSWHDFEADKGLFLDVVFNFIGFVPLGFLLSIVIIQSAQMSVKPTILMTILACFLLSLCIEVAQAWLPWRSSSLLDLVMNTIGAGVGAGVLLFRPR